ncbi:hypothetical protein [Limisalsivibrio acetivorans]|uniref:hypothetical protein n=1 Tax=Limisalsivibrio acetivorans TaxID=1304888 RepID=UPI0003B34A05|nr:hypothetical protein [Limisalsivibrio acetivorans]
MSDVKISFVTPESMESGVVIMLDDAANKGRKRFIYGETAWFRVYAQRPDAVLYSSSAGSIIDAGTASGVLDDEVYTFVESRELKTNVPFRSVSSWKWYGNSLGNISKTDVNRISSDVDPKDGGIAVAKVSLLADYRRFGITVPASNEPEFPVVIYVYGE